MLPPKTQYCVGFMFSESEKYVLLIRKHKPEWQKGYLNGIGGKIEENEIPIDAMVREFREETGMWTKTSDWTHMLHLEAPVAVIHFFTAKGDISQAKTTTDEAIWKVQLYRGTPLPPVGQVIPNLNWIIPLCLNVNKHIRKVQTDLPVKVVEREVN